MMLHKKSGRSRLLKLLALVPIVATALALNAETVTDYRYDEPQKKIVKKGNKNATVKADGVLEVVVVEQTPPGVQKTEPVEMPNGMEVERQSKVFDVVEQMPQFPGGPSALFQYLSANVRYPETAHKAGVEGRIIATFVVEKDGTITESKIVKSVSPELDAEALRVLNSMPRWVPGKQDGQAVRVKYTVPVTFRLQGDSKPATENIVLGKEHKGMAKDIEVVIDDKVLDVTALNGINPADIESMHVEKAKDGMLKDRIIVKMKKRE